MTLVLSSLHRMMARVSGKLLTSKTKTKTKSRWLHGLSPLLPRIMMCPQMKQEKRDVTDCAGTDTNGKKAIQTCHLQRTKAHHGSLE